MIPYNIYFVTYYDGNKYVVVKVEAPSIAEALQQIPTLIEDVASAIEMKETGLTSDLESMFEFVGWTDGEHVVL